MYQLPALARYVVFAAFSLSVLIAVASWLVRTRRISPFGALGRTLRTVSDPVIRPVERRVLRLGGNPVNAGWWLAVGIAAAGVLLLSLLDWLIRTVDWMTRSLAAGPRPAIAFLIVAAYNILFVALLLRVLASWFGFFRYSRFMRLAYALTDWLVEPIRRVLPPGGAIDWSPLGAWLALWLLKQILLSLVGVS
jgi:YggT family protein